MTVKKIVADQFIKDITERPGDFELDEFHVHDKKTNRSWWIANKGYGFKLETPFQFKIGNVGLGFSWHGRRCYRAYLRLLSHRVKKLLGSEQSDGR